MAAKKVKRATTRSARSTPAALPARSGSGQALIVLLRGINVGGNKRVPMVELCALAKKVGAAHVESYIQSGNLLVVTALSPSDFEAALERAIAKHFGFTVD